MAETYRATDGEFRATMDPHSLDVVEGAKHIGSLCWHPERPTRFVLMPGEEPLISLDIGFLERVVDKAKEVTGGVEYVLATELETFDRMLPQLLESHRDEWALIHKNEFGGAHPSQEEAISTGYERFGNVPFLTIQILDEQPVLQMPGRR